MDVHLKIFSLLQILLTLQSFVTLGNSSKHGDLQDIIKDNIEHNLNIEQNHLDSNILHRYRRQEATEQIDLPRKLTLEVGVTLDKRAFDAISKNGNPEKYVFDVMKIVDQRISLLNMSTVLTWLEFWNKKDIMEIAETRVSGLLNKWTKRREEMMQNRWTDASILITGYNFAAVGDPINGLAAQSSTCLNEAGIVVLYKGQSLGRMAQTILHEIGHILTMDHDNRTCCPEGYNKCAMGPTLNDYQVAGPKFSPCSLDSLSKFLKSDQSQCLDNNVGQYPISSSLDLCGNGLVDPGEECDCGGGCLYGCCNCCKKCRLIDSAHCAAGPCCNTTTCQFRPPTFVCNNATSDSCNPPDYCTGDTNQCPEVKSEDGSECTDHENEKSICLSGRCMTRTTQCQQYWSKDFSEAENDCYMAGLTMVGRFAHCGKISDSSYVRCLPYGEENYYKCGMLQCTGPGDNLQETTSFFQNPQKNIYITDTKCLSLSHGPWEAKEGSVMVENGTSCGENKMCYQGDCLAAEDVLPNILNYTETDKPENKTKSFCGNGILEDEEECDCGPTQCDCCKLDTCKFRQNGKGCYSKECFACNGTSEECSTRHLPLMASCNNGEGQCYNGQCSSLALQCKKYYGDFATPVSELYPLNAKSNTSRHNGGGYILFNRRTRSWHSFTEFQAADNDGTCGLLYCKAFVQANVTDEAGQPMISKTYPVRGINSHRVTYFTFETTRDGRDLFDKFYPLLTANGTPCSKEGQKGYCVSTSLQMDRRQWNWYWAARCIVPQSQ